MELFDACLNLSSPAFREDIDSVLSRAYAAGVCYALVCGSSLEDSQEGINLVKTYNQEGLPKLYASVGYHPHNAKLWQDSSSASLERLAQEEEVVALGECGLDYNRNYSPQEQQRQVFQEQLELATKLGLPLFMHQRDAHSDFFAMINDYKDSRMLVHCFTGTGEELEDYIELGCYIGITAWFCDERRGKHLTDLVSLIPKDRLIIETDAPYLMARDLPDSYLVPGRDKRRNEPSYLGHLANALAKVLAEDAEDLTRITLTNTLQFFNIKPA